MISVASKISIVEQSLGNGPTKLVVSIDDKLYDAYYDVEMNPTDKEVLGIVVYLIPKRE